ncbi:MAG: polyprenyl synthetase family protein [Alphaproteobacteria bacterium]|nr:polyprenyl synthetase family protein [Alphaproteobacteria bacterium]
MKAIASKVDAKLNELLKSPDTKEKLIFEAMRYSALSGGKRLRPFLVMTSSSLFNVKEDYALRVAAALEMIHCYSLIHDDLPAMDDDDLRRGQPTNHKKYDEATAILAGDSLLTKAFEVLADEKTHHDPLVRCSLVKALAKASGANGMVGGQVLDIMAEDSEMNLDDIIRLQGLKTGCLISFACEAGAILGNADEKDKHSLLNYSRNLGLAFQIADDILDTEGDAELVGKAVGKDAEAGKATFVSLLGLENARQKASDLVVQASKQLDTFGDKADLLKKVADFVVKRNY